MERVRADPSRFIDLGFPGVVLPRAVEVGGRHFGPFSR